MTATRFPYLGGVVGLEDAGSETAFEVAVVARAMVVAVVALWGWRREAGSAPPSPTLLRAEAAVP